MLALKAYGIAALIMLVLDGLWLAVLARDMYQENLGHMMRQPFRVVPGVLFYLIYVGAIVYLAVLPAAPTQEWVKAALAGAVLGLAAYGTYDLTNYATLKDWPLQVTLIDLAWGTGVSAFTAGATAALLRFVV